MLSVIPFSERKTEIVPSSSVITMNFWVSQTFLNKYFALYRRRVFYTTWSTVNRPFPSSPGLCFKTRIGAQPLIWKSFFILMKIKFIFPRKVVHLASFWKWGFLELGIGLLILLYWGCEWYWVVFVSNCIIGLFMERYLFLGCTGKWVKIIKILKF